MSKLQSTTRDLTIGGSVVTLRGLTARERREIAARCKTGDEMTHEAVRLCTTDENGNPFFAGIDEVLDSPCGYIATLGEQILDLSGMTKEGSANPS